MRWQDSYMIGQDVEVRIVGSDWTPARIVRKTATGQPEVVTAQGLRLGMLRKTEIRPLGKLGKPGPLHHLTQMGVIEVQETPTAAAPPGEEG